MLKAGTTSRPDKTHEEANTLAELQATISALGNQFKWGTEFTVFADPTPTNNGIYRLVYALNNTSKTNPANLLKAGDNTSLFGGITNSAAANFYPLSNGVNLIAGNIQDSGNQTLFAYAINLASSSVGITNLPLKFNNDPDTGLIRNGANTLAIVTGGIVAFSCDALQNVNIPNGRLITTATATRSPLQLGASTTDPTDGAAGYLYYNSTLNAPKYHNGTSWQTFGDPVNRLNSNATVTNKYDLLVVNDVNAKTRIIEGVAYQTQFDNISQTYTIFNAAQIPNQTTIVLEAECAFIEGLAGNTGSAIKVIGTFVKNAAGTLAQVGTTTTPHNQESITGTPTLTFNVTGGNLSVVSNSGGSVGGRSVVKMKALAITNNTFS